MAEEHEQDFAEQINQVSEQNGWMRVMGLRIVRATFDEIVGELEIGPQHLQSYGIVHGGTHSGIIETIASIGAALTAMPRGQSVVGLENHTTFLRAVRSGKLRAVAKPLTRGRRTQVWEANVYDEAGKVAATGRVRLLALDAGAELAGEQPALKTG